MFLLGRELRCVALGFGKEFCVCGFGWRVARVDLGLFERDLGMSGAGGHAVWFLSLAETWAS